MSTGAARGHAGLDWQRALDLRAGPQRGFWQILLPENGIVWRVCRRWRASPPHRIPGDARISRMWSVLHRTVAGTAIGLVSRSQWLWKHERVKRGIQGIRVTFGVRDELAPKPPGFRFLASVPEDGRVHTLSANFDGLQLTVDIDARRRVLTWSPS